jgi:hypothetical protein
VVVLGYIATQYLSCALVGGGVVFCHYYRSMAKSAGNDFRDDAVVPCECVCSGIAYAFAVFWDFRPLSAF